MGKEGRGGGFRKIQLELRLIFTLNAPRAWKALHRTIQLPPEQWRVTSRRKRRTGCNVEVQQENNNSDDEVQAGG